MKKAEERIIGGLLLGGAKEFKIYSSYIGPDGFSDRRCRAIFERMMSFVNRGEDFDSVTINAEFAGDPEITPEYLIDLMDSEISPRMIPNSISVLNDARFRQSIVDIVLHNKTRTARDTAEKLQAEIWKYHSGTATTWEIREALHRTMDRIEHRRSGKVEFSYGIGELDRVLGGLYRKETTIIAARPGMGKSALAMNIANSQIDDGKTVLYIDLESGDESMLERFLCRRTGIGIKSIHHGHLTDGMMQRLTTASAELEKKPLVINDRAGISVGEIYNQALDIKADMIIVDYINLMASSTEKMGEVDTLGNAALGLHEAAKNLNIPIIIICQLNRGPENRTGNEPNIADLRGSGKLEEYADNIILLFWGHKYNAEEHDEHVSTAIIVKQKQGDIGRVQLYWEASKLYFGELQRRAA